MRLSILTRTTLYPGVPRLEIHTVVQNRAKDHRLQVHFPFPGGDGSGRTEEKPVARFDGHFEIVQRSLVPPADDSDWVER